MPGRGVNSNAYRYGFNGKEKDDEVKGEGNQQDYGMRIYDTRLGRFLSVDPIGKHYAFYTPYSFAGNNPVEYIDLDGGEQKKPSVHYGEYGVMTMAVDQTAAAYTEEQINNKIHPVKPPAPPPPPAPKPQEAKISAMDMSPGAIKSREIGDVNNWVNQSKKQMDGTFEGGGGEFGMGSSQTLQDAVQVAPGVIIPEMMIGYASESIAMVKAARSFDKLLEESKIVKDGSAALIKSNEGSAANAFNQIVKDAGGSADNIVDQGNGVSTFTKGEDTYTLRGSKEGSATISKATKGVYKETKIRFGTQ